LFSWLFDEKCDGEKVEDGGQNQAAQDLFNG
jgi:hypothetical protein